MTKRQFMNIDATINSRRQWLDKLKEWRGLDKDSHLLDWLIELGRQEMKSERRRLADLDREKLFEMFVAPDTYEEIAGMDVAALTQYIRGLRANESDTVFMTDGAVARAILEFARKQRREAQRGERR